MKTSFSVTTQADVSKRRGSSVTVILIVKTGPTKKAAVSGISVQLHIVLLWPPCVADADIIFLPCNFFLSFFFLFLA